MNLSPRTNRRRVPSAWMSFFAQSLGAVVVLGGGLAAAHAQSTAATPTVQAASGEQIGEIERRLTSLTDTLVETQAALQRSQAELIRLRAEVSALRAQSAAQKPDTGAPETVASQPGTSSSAAAPATLESSGESEMQALKERQEILEAEVKQHDQTKVETASKYSLAVTGLALFNAYSTAGVVDNADLPSLALLRAPGTSHGSLGASVRQTVLGLVATGPVIGGAQSSASINIDFFGGLNSNGLGYSAPNGYVRMRDTELGLTWKKSRVELGYYGPLISPRSPTSFATVAQPALSESGNLWIWSPQLEFQQSLPVGDEHGISLEAGLISPYSPGYTSTQLDSPIEASRRPGVEGRIAYHSDITAPARSLVFGVGGYAAKQVYDSATHVNAWAVTGDWQVPLAKQISLSGEIYRGSSLGGLGGGLYKDVLYGTDPVSGEDRTVGVDAAGGWTQLKFTLGPRWETNAMFGLDDAFSSSFRAVILPTSSSTLTYAARNSTVTGNLIFRPLASLILSPEYRRITTWNYLGAPNVANIFTLSAGYKF